MKTKRIICKLLAGIMSAVFAGCSSSGKGLPDSLDEMVSSVKNGASEVSSDGVPMASKENVYRAQTIKISEIGGTAGNFREVYPYGGNMLIFMDFAGAENRTVAATVDFEGVLLNYIELEKPAEDGAFSKFCVSPNGEICAAFNFGQVVSFVRYNGGGGIVSSVVLSEAIKNQDNLYIRDIISDDNGNIYFITDYSLYIMDQNGKIVFESQTAEDSWISSIFKAGDGRVFISESKTELTSDGSLMYLKLKEVDSENDGFGAEFEVEGLYGVFLDGNESYDAYISTGESLYGYDIETGEKTQAADWVNSGLDATAMSMDGVSVFPDGSILCATYNYQASGGMVSFNTAGGINLTRLVRLDPSEVPDRKLITLSALYLDYTLKNAIVEFNKTSDEYQVEAVSYMEGQRGAANDAVSKLNMDLTAGRIPDIIINLPYESLPMSSYISKGLFEDIYKLMDEDETFDKEDYVGSVFKALEENGGLYRVFTSFGISTIVGKTSDVGSEKGWSMEDFNEFLASKPADVSAFDVSMFSSFSRDRFLTDVISTCRNEFINPETGECSFNSDEFIELIEFSYKLHNKSRIDAASVSDYDRTAAWVELQTAYRYGDPLLMHSALYSFKDIRQYEKYNFGEEITFKGFPNAGAGNGSAFESGFELSISKKAANKDGAWEFMKFLMTDAQEDPSLRSGFPIKLTALETLKEKAKQEPENKSSEQGVSGVVEMISMGAGPAAYSGDEDIGANTDADNEKVMDLINSVTLVARYDNNINKIVSEEAAAFFEGQKSAAEAAEIIQNRVSLYVSEISG